MCGSPASPGRASGTMCELTDAALEAVKAYWPLAVVASVACCVLYLIFAEVNWLFGVPTLKVEPQGGAQLRTQIETCGERARQLISG